MGAFDNVFARSIKEYFESLSAKRRESSRFVVTIAGDIVTITYGSCQYSFDIQKTDCICAQNFMKLIAINTICEELNINVLDDISYGYKQKKGRNISFITIGRHKFEFLKKPNMPITLIGDYDKTSTYYAMLCDAVEKCNVDVINWKESFRATFNKNLQIYNISFLKPGNSHYYNGYIIYDNMTAFPSVLIQGLYYIELELLLLENFMKITNAFYYTIDFYNNIIIGDIKIHLSKQFTPSIHIVLNEYECAEGITFEELLKMEELQPYKIMRKIAIHYEE